MIYYKVVTEELKSLGLRRNPNIMDFPLGYWIIEPTPVEGKGDKGGIWCCKKKSAARALKKYYEKRYGPALIFQCHIGEVLYQNSYRTKTDAIKLITEVHD
jgi:hypothetical protein